MTSKLRCDHEESFWADVYMITLSHHPEWSPREAAEFADKSVDELRQRMPSHAGLDCSDTAAVENLS